MATSVPAGISPPSLAATYHAAWPAGGSPMAVMAAGADLRWQPTLQHPFAPTGQD